LRPADLLRRSQSSAFAAQAPLGAYPGRSLSLAPAIDVVFNSEDTLLLKDCHATPLLLAKWEWSYDLRSSLPSHSAAAPRVGTQFVGEELSEGNHVADTPVASPEGDRCAAPPPLPVGEQVSQGPAEARHPTAEQINQLFQVAEAGAADVPVDSSSAVAPDPDAAREKLRAAAVRWGVNPREVEYSLAQHPVE